MEAKITDKKLKATEKSVPLNEVVWNSKVNNDLVAQVVNVYRSNARSSSASVKNRGEVRGGGRKPWRQKGTGRARHGSTRSPIWVGGGVTFGPSGRNWKRTVNKKMRLAALASVLTKRLAVGEVYFVDRKDLERDLISNFKSAMVVTADSATYKKVRNLKKVNVQEPKVFNALEALSGEALIIDVDSVNVIEERFADGK